jgi:hypothetical protein
MADRIIKPDSGNDVVIQNNNASSKIEINNDGSINFTGSSSQLVPANLVAYRASGQSTPSGWSEYTSARGRMIVGLPSGGTDGGTVGTALTNQQNKTHSHSQPTHAHRNGYTQFHEFAWKYPHVYGTSGTVNRNYYVASASVASSSGDNDASLTQAAGDDTTGDASTSDVLAYIQLMTIKKD